ncbi:STAS domain-containing protein [Microbacterium rhizomatis]|uniref:STAS domain-containing protein n=1 Tax=Microbacterium rhizomatis TaxID=1631477 RepID=A0A5J5IYS0_9MICO|nr:STAS domain-containing protein [Microbacterium rhizomatis]KAA9107511.1 STAS domain-containing protein [Microbacterium rhizomatis]
MTFTAEKVSPDIVIVRGAGTLDMVSALELRAIIAAAISRGDCRIAMDLSGIDDVDWSGLGALVSCLTRARRAGGDLRIAEPSDAVVLGLHRSKLERVFEVFDSADGAYRE